MASVIVIYATNKKRQSKIKFHLKLLGKGMKSSILPPLI